MLTKDDIRRLIEGGGTEIAASTTQENDANTQERGVTTQETTQEKVVTTQENDANTQERGATTQEADDMAPKSGDFTAKTGELAAKTSENTAKTGEFAAKTSDFAAEQDAVDKALRVALSDKIKSERNSVRDAIFSKCRHVYFTMKGEAAISSRALAGKLEMSPRSVSKYQALLVQAGLLTHIGPTNGGEWKFSI